MPKGNPNAYKVRGKPKSGLKRNAKATARNKGQRGIAKRNVKASGRGR